MCWGDVEKFFVVVDYAGNLLVWRSAVPDLREAYRRAKEIAADEGIESLIVDLLGGTIKGRFYPRQYTIHKATKSPRA